MANENELPVGFDPAYYLLINGDVAAAGVDPVEHYLRHGRQEGRPYSRTRPPPVTNATPSIDSAERSIEAPALLRHLRSGLGRGEAFKTLAVVGSAPSAPHAEELIGAETTVITLNNAWRAVTRRDYAFYAEDLPEASKPPFPERALRGRTSPQYDASLSHFGGSLYCGASMSFVAGYWIVHTLPCSQVSYFASDMIYRTAQSHFYGQGTPDPLRPDPSLQDHAAKCLRLFYFGLQHGCLFLNASSSPETRLAFPRVRGGESLSVNVMAELAPALAEALHDCREFAERALACERSVDFASMQAHLVYDEAAWKHAAEVDGYWRALAPVAQHVESLVDGALHRSK